LHSASGSDVLLRLIERPLTASFTTLHTHGWNANEILVTDPFALEKRIRKPGSPFSVIGTTAALDSNLSVLALQALGPDDELNYFTKIPPAGGMFIKHAAQAFVDRTFIAIVGGPSITALREFYEMRLGMSVTAPFASKVPVLNTALGLPAEQRILLAPVPLSAKFALQLDEYPANTVPRPRRNGDLLSGIAMVSFEVNDLEETLSQHFFHPLRMPPSLARAQPSSSVPPASGSSLSRLWSKISDEGMERNLCHTLKHRGDYLHSFLSDILVGLIEAVLVDCFHLGIRFNTPTQETLGLQNLETIH